jgi:hypothetical protein
MRVKIGKITGPGPAVCRARLPGPMEVIMDKWEKYKTYKNWQQENIDSLKRDFDDCRDERIEMIEPPSFNDYCLGIWQRL